MALFQFGQVFFYLIFCHAIADYAGQGDFMARAKNHTAPIPGVPWVQALTAHAIIHAGLVVWVTGFWGLALGEFGLHWLIDYAKSDGLLGEGESAFHLDQGLHVLCKLAWATVWVLLTFVG